MRITDYERTAEVQVSKDGYFTCPKCRGVCTLSRALRLWDCDNCGRGWIELYSAEDIVAAFNALTPGQQYLIIQTWRVGQ